MSSATRGSETATFIPQGSLTTCSNNCRGVDPNSVIGAGVAAVALTGFIEKY